MEPQGALIPFANGGLQTSTAILLGELLPPVQKEYHFYFLPFSPQTLDKLPGSEIVTASHPPERFKQAKERLMMGVYQGTIGTVVALMNTDALQDMRRAYTTLHTLVDENTYPDDERKAEADMVLANAAGILASLETRVRGMQHYPIHDDRCEDVSQRVAEYNTLIQSKFLSAGKSYSLASHYQVHEPRDRIRVWHYGTESNGHGRDTWQDVKAHLMLGHFGNPESIHDTGARDWGTAGLKIRTGSGTYFSLKNRPDRDSEIRELYGVNVDTCLAPAFLRVSTEYSTNGLHNVFLDAMQNSLKGWMHHRTLSFDNKAVLLFCPKQELESSVDSLLLK